MDRFQDQGQARSTIDAGAARDKISGLDPTVAPMETDAEAAGMGGTARIDESIGLPTTPQPPHTNPAGVGNGPSPTAAFTMSGVRTVMLVAVIVVLVAAIGLWAAYG